MDTATTTSTDLVIPQGAELATLFRKPQGMDAILARIEADARAQALDVTTKKGRDAIASLAHKIARSKTALDDAGKALNEDARRQINAVDAERRKVRDRLDALKEEVRAPLTAWEKAEEDRVSAIKARLGRITDAVHRPLATAADAADLIARIEAVALDDAWGEFLADAAKAKDATLASLRRTHADMAEREAQAAELARLRAEAEARAEEDRKRAEAEAAERARLQAEQEARERAERIEREKQEAARRAAQEAEARAKAEAERAAREAAEREAALQRQIAEQAAREEQARREAEIRHAREVAEAQAAAERAAQAERDRIAAEERAKAEAEARRRADAAHRAKIVADIADALRAMAGRATPEAIADAIFDGQIPHVRVVA